LQRSPHVGPMPGRLGARSSRASASTSSLS